MLLRLCSSWLGGGEGSASESCEVASGEACGSAGAEEVGSGVSDFIVRLCTFHSQTIEFAYG